MTENESKPMSTKELSSAVTLLMEKEESRAKLQRQKRRRRVRRNVRCRRDQMQSSVNQLTHSIEVIKWCIVGIATVMAISLMILVLVVWQIGNEAQRIKGEVEQIKVEAGRIRDKIQNPLRSIGGAIGGKLDGRLGDLLDLEE